MQRTVFFISDGTGLTAEALGHSLLTQFEKIQFNAITIPYVNDVDKARSVAHRIDAAYAAEKTKPLVFTTLLNPIIYQIIHETYSYHVDFFERFIEPLEKELATVSSHTTGKTHGLRSYKNYMKRMNAINYAIANDDGTNTNDYKRADIIITGVSRSGKTPTCIYLALQYGLYAANYPLTQEDFITKALPDALLTYRDKLIGLTIDPERLQQIRSERRPNSRYAELENCQYEVAQGLNLFRRFGIRYLNTTTHSIEEIAAEILSLEKVEKRI
ncbi:MAG: pyruvate, water dikinase regulatory protein [Pseudomonadota bacterium]